MLATVTAVLVFAATCDEPGEPPTPTTAQERRETYEIIRGECRSLGASDVVCEVLVAMAWRETRGRPALVHTRGPNEFGEGLFAHGRRFWSWLLPDELGPDRFCDPRNATRAQLREFQWAYKKGARRLMHLQRPHAGRSPRNDEHPHADARFCYLLKHGPRDDQHVVSWEVDCQTKLRREDLGRPLDDEALLELAKKPKP